MEKSSGLDRRFFEKKESVMRSRVPGETGNGLSEHSLFNPTCTANTKAPQGIALSKNDVPPSVLGKRAKECLNTPERAFYTVPADFSLLNKAHQY